jgi:hypothetical protein
MKVKDGVLVQQGYLPAALLNNDDIRIPTPKYQLNRKHPPPPKPTQNVPVPPRPPRPAPRPLLKIRPRPRNPPHPISNNILPPRSANHKKEHHNPQSEPALLRPLLLHLRHNPNRRRPRIRPHLASRSPTSPLRNRHHRASLCLRKHTRPRLRDTAPRNPALARCARDGKGQG